MMPNEPKTSSLDLTALRKRLDGTRGKQYWRSLEEVAGTDEFRRFIEDEFPGRCEEWLNPVRRRDLLRFMAASFGLAGLSGCTRMPTDYIVPYVRQPEELVLGRPIYYATAMPLDGYGTGIIVESHEGRPTKVEGNPDHPASLGATDAFAQASVLTLYDPDRSQAVLHVGRVVSWPRFVAAMAQLREQQTLRRGAGLRILTGRTTSPTMEALMRQVLGQFPLARWHRYDAAVGDGAVQGARAAFGRPVNTIYALANVEVILSLDSDFLHTGPGALRYSREWADRRRVTGGDLTMNRMYAVESTLSVTGGAADHRLPLRSGLIEAFARNLARRLGVAPDAPALNAGSPEAHWIEPLARDLEAHRGRSLVVAGEYQPAAIHALAHGMNQALGNIGRTVFYTDPVEVDPVEHGESLLELVNAMRDGQVEALLIAGCNPVYDAPADLDFAGQMGRVPLRVHLGLYRDETAFLCHWHVPESHFLESWGDIRAYDGTVSLIQPLIEPLYQSRSIYEFMATLTDNPMRRGYEIVREHWREERPGDDFEEFWKRSLHDGFVRGTAQPPLTLTPDAGGIGAIPLEAPALPGIEISFRPDPTIWDGRFANNGWLQELPKPLTKLTWDNAAVVGPALAERLGLRSQDVVELRYLGRNVQAPVWVLPGQADDAVTVYLGYGRTRAGRIGERIGFDAYALRTSTRPWGGPGLEVAKTGRRYQLATTQMHHAMEGRPIVKTGTLTEFREHPDFAHDEHHIFTLLPDWPYPGYKWGMAIDQTICTGCSACVVACQAENNIPVVGKREVARGREMHWLRIDRYFSGPADNPEVLCQPMLCVHCETAPCELVCPVAATVHSADGLNQMIYNRCVGTRYCSNNCPYKVRRFNFYLYSDWKTPSLRAMRNPDVTVRSRGVMEKCSYCIQRISRARIDAEREGRRIRDGEVVTACQAACPTRAIVFGDINDPESQVGLLKRNSLNYGVLSELGTRPRTTYLARLTNPNPELLPGGGA
ncbi:MAG: TAT-variant-translocated molybdopterin oxidoreductase [Bryobacteraceae bacterium]